MQKTLYRYVFRLALSLSVWAVGVIPALAQEVDWHYMLAGEVIIQSGNVDNAIGTLRGGISREDSLLEFNLAGTFSYGEQDDIKNQQDAEGIFAVDLHPHSFFSPFMFANAGFSFQKRIDLRWQLGLGGKIVFLRIPDHKASFSAAAVFDATEYEALASLKDKRTARLSLRLKGKHEFVDGNLVFSHLTFLIPAFERLEDYRWTTLLTLDVPVSKVVSLRSSFSNQFENIVPRGRRKHDSKFLFGVKLDF